MAELTHQKYIVMEAFKWPIVSSRRYYMGSLKWLAKRKEIDGMRR
jgi:hypothetical protein